jgi:hypothetical protein
MKRVSFAALYGLFLALCVESALRAFYRVTAGQWLWERIAIPIYRPDPHAGVFNRPNLDYEHRTGEFRAHYYTNPSGLRVAKPSPDFSVEKPPDVKRVMLLGASFAFGWGVDYEDTFAGRLEAGLRADPAFTGGKRLELLNAGVPSLPERDQLRWFREVGSRYRPDVVVQLMYGSLDVPEWPVPEADAEGYLVRRNPTLAARLRAEAKRFATVFYAWTVWARFQPHQQIEGAGRRLENAKRFEPEAPNVAASLAYYEGLRAAVRDAGAELVIVYYPLSYVVHAADVARWRHLGVTDPEAQVAFDAAFCRHLVAPGFDCTNGTEVLRAASAASKERLYYFVDVHWTAAGSRVAAEHALAHLRSRERSLASNSAAAN